MAVAVLEPLARIVAHRGFSSRQPEMTLAAYQEAVEWSLATGVPLGLECDVTPSADGELVCLHDPTLDRTSDGTGRVADHTLAELRRLDFGSWLLPRASVAQRSLMTLADLVELTADARHRGADVTLHIETKHPRQAGPGLEHDVCRLLARCGWDAAGSPVRLITFSVPGVQTFARLAPLLPRTLLIERRFGALVDGRLPRGVTTAGVSVALLRRDPGYVARARAWGNEVHAWTLNTASDIEFCRRIGVTGFTTDHPDRVHDVLDPAAALVAAR